ncbi:VIT domain-containing protein [Pontibacter sp. G13]|uniref:VIT domain-containing protein n=1 Tax=Pontibacter sp. G13 TaxID=3074898 RepID=UPI00288C0721|nr:VIT domain-containing protein [Pontibacter sp. G13]WNJ16618.1 VIT domain-containing protein [Pontibacter sp. G13]
MHQPIRFASILAIVLMGSFASIFAQSHPITLQAPKFAVLVKPEGDTASQPLSIAQMEVQMATRAHWVLTTFDVWVANPSNREMSGKLHVPLNDGQKLTGFALEVNGEMRPGVVVEKQQARVAYESTVRQGIDPGLVEWVGGNTFKAQIFPIPSGGTKHFQITVESEVPIGATSVRWELPLAEGIEVRQLALKALIEGSKAPRMELPQGKTGLFSESGTGWQASVQIKHPETQPAAVLTFDRSAETQVWLGDVRGSVPFYVQTLTALSKVKAPRPKKVGIIWDRSLSTQSRDLETTLDALEAWLGRIQPQEIHVQIVNDHAEFWESVSWSHWKRKEMRNKLAAVPADGATQLGVIDFNKVELDAYLWVTDGVNTFGNPALTWPAMPVHILDPHEASATEYLKFFARMTGGQYLSVDSQNFSEMMALTEQAPKRLLSVRAKSGEVKDVLPDIQLNGYGGISVAGMLVSESAELELGFGINGKITDTQVIQLSRAGQTASTKWLGRKWAEQKLSYLLPQQEKFKADIVQLGEQYQIVTPFTSLIVLDRVEDYVRHKIEPPASLKKEYDKLMALETTSAENTQTALLNQAATAFQARIDWWNQQIDLKKIETKYQYDLDSLRKGIRSMREQLAVDAASAPQIHEVQNLVVLRTLHAELAKQLELEALRKQMEEMRERRDQMLQQGDSSGMFQSGDYDDEFGADDVASDEMGTADYDSDEPMLEEDLSRMGELAGSMPGMAAEAAPDEGAGGFYSESEESDAFEADVSEGMEDQSTDRINDIDLSERQNLPFGAESQEQVNQSELKIQLGEWVPDAPYLAVLDSASDPYWAYLALRDSLGTAPAFYLDVARWFHSHEQSRLARTILSNLAEIELEQQELLRVFARQLEEWEEYELAQWVYEDVLRMRPEEPQSYRDLGLILAKQGQNQAAVDTLYRVVAQAWDGRFPDITTVVAHEMNAIIHRAGTTIDTSHVDPRLLADLPTDVRVVLEWDSDNTDMDLWVTDPYGEKCYYQHKRTKIGGMISNDFTGGYGPEEFLLKQASQGEYKVEVNYYGTRQTGNRGPTTIRVIVFKHYGTAEETTETITFRLGKNSQVFQAATFTVE